MSKTSRSGSAMPEAPEESEYEGSFDVLRLVSATQPRSGNETFGGSVTMRPLTAACRLQIGDTVMVHPPWLGVFIRSIHPVAPAAKFV